MVISRFSALGKPRLGGAAGFGGSLFRLRRRLRLHGARVSFISERNGVRHTMLSLRSDHFSADAWHLVLCKPNRHHIACRQLGQMGFDIFMPLHEVERRRQGRVRVERRPVFGGYIFVSAGQGRGEWHRVRSTPGVAQIVGFGGGAPALVPAGIIGGLMGRCDPDGLLRPDQDFTAGDRIRITSGPFSEFVATIEHVDAARRVHVLLDILGGKTRAALDPRRVMRAS
jgi:transcriptional antiterminator RfaH